MFIWVIIVSSNLVIESNELWLNKGNILKGGSRQIWLAQELRDIPEPQCPAHWLLSVSLSSQQEREKDKDRLLFSVFLRNSLADFTLISQLTGVYKHAWPITSQSRQRWNNHCMAENVCFCNKITVHILLGEVHGKICFLLHGYHYV